MIVENNGRSFPLRAGGWPLHNGVHRTSPVRKVLRWLVGPIGLVILGALLQAQAPFVTSIEQAVGKAIRSYFSAKPSEQDQIVNDIVADMQEGMS